MKWITSLINSNANILICETLQKRTGIRKIFLLTSHLICKGKILLIYIKWLIHRCIDTIYRPLYKFTKSIKVLKKLLWTLPLRWLQEVPWLSLSRYPSLSSIAPGKSSRLRPVSAQSWADITLQHHHHHVTPSAWITLTLSHHPS